MFLSFALQKSVNLLYTLAFASARILCCFAIYGDYKDILPIKDKLKEIGCRYNKFLNINGVKTPGWIVSAKKRAEVGKIIIKNNHK